MDVHFALVPNPPVTDGHTQVYASASGLFKYQPPAGTKTVPSKPSTNGKATVAETVM